MFAWLEKMISFAKKIALDAKDELTGSWYEAGNTYAAIYFREQFEDAAAQLSKGGKKVRTRYSKGRKCVELFIRDGSVLGDIVAQVKVTGECGCATDAVVSSESPSEEMTELFRQMFASLTLEFNQTIRRVDYS